MSRKKKSWTIDLSSADLLDAMHQQLIADFLPEEERFALDPMELELGFSERPGRFWEAMGTTVRIEQGGRKLQVRVENVADIFLAHTALVLALWLNRAQGFYGKIIGPELAQATLATAAEAAEFGLAMKPPLDKWKNYVFFIDQLLAALRAADWENVLSRFESIAHVEQLTLLDDARFLAANQTLSLQLTERLNAALGERPDKVTGFAVREQLSHLLTFFEMFYWEESVVPRRVVEQYLSPDIAPMPLGGEDPKKGKHPPAVVELSSEEVRRTAPSIDSERCDFYTDTLGCRRVLRLLGPLGDCCAAYLLQAKSGRHYAVLDSKKRGSPAFVFTADWSSGEPRLQSFERRFYHCVEWQKHVRRFLNNN